MPRTCWAPGCTTGYRSNPDTDRHLFSVPDNKCQEWSRRIPRQGQLISKHYLCDLHFEEQFLKKTYDYIIDGKSVSLPRKRWKLTADAVPTLFPNLSRHLSTRVSERQRSIVNGQSRKRKVNECILLNYHFKCFLYMLFNGLKRTNKAQLLHRNYW